MVYKSVKSLVSKTDMLGMEYKLRYKGNTSHKTCFGGILTILLFATVTVSAIFFGREIFERNNPIMTTSHAKVENNEIPLKKIGFHLVLTDAAGTQLVKDPEFMKSITMRAMMANFVLEGKTLQVKFDLLFVEPCKEEFLEPEYWAEKTKSMDLSTYFCINPSKYIRDGKLVEEEVVVRNSYTELGASTFWFNLRLCDKNADPTCDQWLQRRKDFFVQANIADYYFDGSKADPVELNTKHIFTLVGSSFAFIENVSLVMTQATADEGFMFEQKQDYLFHSFKEKKLNTQIFDPLNPNIYDMTIDMPKLINTITRRYTKIQELLANIGGFMKAVIIVFNAVAGFVSEFSFFREYRKQFLNIVHRKEEFIRKVSEGGENERKSVIKFNTSSLNLKRQRSEANKKTRLTLGRYLISLFSANYAKENKMEKNVIFKYFDVDFLMLTLVEQEKASAEIKRTVVKR